MRYLIGIAIAIALVLFRTGFFAFAAADVKVDLPEGWTFTETIPGIELAASSPPDGDAVEENIAITSEPVPFTVSLEKYLDASLDAIRKEIPEFTETARGETMIGGHEGVWVVIRHHAHGLHIEQKIYLTIFSGHGYAIACTATTHTMNRYEADFDSIVNSITFE